jgi:carboxyl-terminal processing protease
MRQSVKNAGLLSLGALAGVLLSITFSADANKGGAVNLPYEELRIFADVFSRIKQDYVEPVNDKKLMREAIQGMVSGLDPHSVFLDEEGFKELQVSTQGQFGGLGIEVSAEDGLVKVIAPIEDTPAFHAGIRSGDLITKVDKKAVRGLSLNEAVKLMRGEPGTKVTLTVYRKGEDQPLVMKLERAIIHVQSVKAKLIEPGYGWIRISQFQENTLELLVKKLSELQTKGSLKGLVLDLRDDPGGLLNAAVGVSAAFLPKDSLVVYTDGRLASSKLRLYARPEFYGNSKNDDPLHKLSLHFRSTPIVVLVNGGSASASEIVSGALQDHKRAKVMGTPTFGKASVQTIIPLGNSNTAIKLTTARYYTPNGRSIQAKGIVPDIMIEQETMDGTGTPSRIKEADLLHHLENKNNAADKDDDSDKSDSKASDDKDSDTPGKTKENTLPIRKKPLEYGGADDYQLTQALNQLKGLPVVPRSKAKPAPDKTASTKTDSSPSESKPDVKDDAKTEVKVKAGTKTETKPNTSAPEKGK